LTWATLPSPTITGATTRPSSTLFEKIKNAPRPADRARLLGDAQRLLAEEAVHGFLYQPQWVTVANKNLKGLWKDMPIFVNDLSALSWS
jgi:peptide/nickel transport system substrate-binding protein